MSAEIHIRRSKIRRMFENQFRVINSHIHDTAIKQGYPEKFHVKYSPHFLDRIIMRELDETAVLNLLSNFHNDFVFEEVMSYLLLPPLPDDQEEIDVNVNYRELRLELTDGKLWIGLTADKTQNSPGTYGLCCRMGIINVNRKPGKISTRLIDVTKL